MVCTKSPLTGGFARSSAGGDFGAWLKFSGYDSIIIEGKAKRPVYIHLTHDSCQIHDANELWGKGTQETQEILRQSCGKDARIACIGPAGERLVRYAAIITKDRVAGRCGVGTVMGSKNLKAIVVTARRSVKLRDPETFKQLVKEQIGIFNDNDSCQHHKVMGTIDTQDITSSLGVFPVKNFRYGCMADWKKIAGQEYQKLEVGREGCYSCSIQCGHAHYVPTGRKIYPEKLTSIFIHFLPPCYKYLLVN
ncbi:putative oxidoreductase YdhV [subsurface metagenome]